MVSSAVPTHDEADQHPRVDPALEAGPRARAERTLLVRRRRPIAEPAEDAVTLSGSAGAGRVVLALAQLGLPMDDVEQLIVDPEWTAARIDRLDLDAGFPLVVLGSHLVNRPDEPMRAALLRLARRHLALQGTLLVEHHPVDWAETAAPTAATPGGAPGMVDVVIRAPFVSAVSVYDAGGHELRQPFTARVLSDADLAAELAEAGLRVTARRAPTWIEAAHA
jgi:hypothetical protein